ncbi:Inactive UDP-glycosyltransferase 79A6 [Glycine max]|nr:Inactive UDP-glycosyltransferase 79A6 [Glycine max]
MELEIESQFMNEACLELNNTIEHSIQNDKKEKEILCKRKNMLMGELEQLLTLVKQKETEITNNDYNLEVVKNKINKIVSRFKEMQSSIQQGITSFKQMIIFIDKRVLKLELEKKVASAVRNFKEVARIAIKAKSLYPQNSNIISLKTFEVMDFMVLFTRFGEENLTVFKTCKEIERPYLDYIETQFRKPVVLSGPLVPEPSSVVQIVR